MKCFGSALRFFRRLVALASFLLLTYMFIDYGMSYPAISAKLCQIQFLPAALSFSFAIFIIWLLVTLLFGRIYCSTICPLGVFQDIFARIPRMGKVRPKWFYHYAPARTGFRYALLALVVLSMGLGISAVTSLLDPYSVFGRFSSYILKPLWGGVQNIISEVNGEPRIRIMTASLFGMVLSGGMMLIIACVSLLFGRSICNVICPVGTTLGLVSKYSLFRIDINTDKCIQCRRCEHKCKASCIDMISHVVDTSRCVACFDCLTDCPNDAISYTSARHRLSIPMMQSVKPLAGSSSGLADASLEINDADVKEDATTKEEHRITRRKFLLVSMVTGANIAMAKTEKISQGVDMLENGSSVHPTLPVTPPGVRTRNEFLARCTSCGLCISHCPQKVLKPSAGEYGILRTLHPVMDFNQSWCLYDCTRCSRLCPTGALQPLSLNEKHHTRIGYAHAENKLCISWADGVKCGACSRRCPVEAINMVTDATGSGPHPVVDTARCIGCGACQYVCPSTPKAIVVTGLP